MKWVALIIFGGLGAGVLAGGLLWGFRRQALWREGRRTTGTVVAQEKHTDTTDQDGSEVKEVSYYPVIEFEALGGEKVRFTGSTGRGKRPDFRLGAPVDVIYDPAHPARAQIASFSQFWLGPLTLIIAGAIFLAMGIGSFFLIRGSDEVLGEAFQKRVDRDMLVFQPDAIRIRGQIANFHPNPADDGKTSILICTGRITENEPETLFDSDAVPAELAGSLVGRPVMITIDPRDHDKYLVELGPLLSGSAERKGGP